jgi:hypothetical protein
MVFNIDLDSSVDFCVGDLVELSIGVELGFMLLDTFDCETIYP